MYIYVEPWVHLSAIYLSFLCCSFFSVSALLFAGYFSCHKVVLLDILVLFEWKDDIFSSIMCFLNSLMWSFSLWLSKTWVHLHCCTFSSRHRLHSGPAPPPKLVLCRQTFRTVSFRVSSQQSKENTSTVCENGSHTENGQLLIKELECFKWVERWQKMTQRENALFMFAD